MTEMTLKVMTEVRTPHGIGLLIGRRVVNGETTAYLVTHTRENIINHADLHSLAMQEGYRDGPNMTFAYPVESVKAWSPSARRQTAR